NGTNRSSIFRSAGDSPSTPNADGYGSSAVDVASGISHQPKNVGRPSKSASVRTATPNFVFPPTRSDSRGWREGSSSFVSDGHNVPSSQPGGMETSSVNVADRR